MMTVEAKAKLIKAFAKNPTDVGSCEVQIAILSERIRQVSAHLKAAHKDYSSQRGLMMLVGKRRSFMRYLERTNAASYKKTVDSLKAHGLM